MKNIIQILCTFILLGMACKSVSAQTGLYIQSGEITVEPGSLMYIKGDVENHSTGILNEGEVFIEGNIANYTTVGPFNYDSDGTVYLNSEFPQTVSGSHIVNLANLDLTLGSGTVTLQSTDGSAGVYVDQLNLGARVVDLNGYWMGIRLNNSPAALNRTSGYIISEDQNSYFLWNTGFSLDTYTIPFGTAAGDYIPMTATITNVPADPGENFPVFSTYPTSDDNAPFPADDGVTNMNFGGNDMSSNAVDRFWKANLGGRTADITCSYATTDLDGNTITESELIGLQWNGTGWEMTGTGSAYNGAGSQSVTISGYASTTTEWISLASPPVSIHISVLLEGPYNPATATMNTTLRLNDLIPSDQPFNQPPWNYAGTENVPAPDIPLHIVDWILIEVRDGSNADNIITRKAAFLNDSGIVESIDGRQGVVFTDLDPGQDYYIIVRTRNHLATLSENTVNAPNQPGTPYDFTNPANVSGGAAQLKEIAAGLYAQQGGDYNSDGVMTVADFNYFVSESSIINVYADSDGNMDKAVTVADFNLFQSNASSIGVPQVRY